jgi:hypothetical protein
MLDAWNNLTKKERRYLVIGDLHEPFCLDGYLDFCKDTYRKYNCNQVVFIGDVIDSHYSSFHETDPDGMGGGQELELAIKRLARWVEAFPVADVTIGNHDRIISKQSLLRWYSKGLDKVFQRSLERSDLAIC